VRLALTLCWLLGATVVAAQPRTPPELESGADGDGAETASADEADDIDTDANDDADHDASDGETDSANGADENDANANDDAADHDDASVDRETADAFDADLVFDVPVDPDAVTLDPSDAVRWETLRELRLEHRVERIREGRTLLGAGVLSAAVGIATAAIARRDDSFWLAYGLTTLSFAAFNIPLGVALLDLGGGSLEAIENDRAGTRTLFDGVRERALDEQRGKRASFAINAALDVLYIAAGALLVGLADRMRSEDAARGAGWSMLHQSAFLLAYDLAGIAGTSRRLRELRTRAF